MPQNLKKIIIISFKIAAHDMNTEIVPTLVKFVQKCYVNSIHTAIQDGPYRTLSVFYNKNPAYAYIQYQSAFGNYAQDSGDITTYAIIFAGV